MRRYVRDKKPAWRRSQSAWLFPDGSVIGQKVWVKVPVCRGRTRAFKATHMEIGLWMDVARGGSIGTVNGENRSIRIDRFPFDEPQDLKHSFTIVVADQSSDQPTTYPQNMLINGLVPELTQPWIGNVLVFKHGTTAMKGIINLKDEDSALVEAIVKRYDQTPGQVPTLTVLQSHS
ncbi:hypothetical protein R3P38DRAFT_3238209 [Favolaschia claudopus]|uniref:Uncharacterized protein n=1 Tax=Favolaschia claudopus TaxID=2862362 RepID=A0AAV9ZAS4_9AGAR